MKDKEKAFEQKKKAEQKAIGYYCRNKTVNQIEIQNFVMQGEFFSYDNFIISANTEYVVEIKVRENYSYNAIKSFGGQILEKKKLEGIKNQLKIDKTNCEILYFIFFKDRLCIYKLDRDINDYLWIDKLLPKDNYDKKLIWKEVTMLSESDILETIKYQL
jgi:hypothetical protein